MEPRVNINILDGRITQYLADTYITSIFRPVRALMFVSLGLFGVIPACHHLLVSGWHTAYIEAAMHRVFIQAGLYILGELLIQGFLFGRLITQPLN